MKTIYFIRHGEGYHNLYNKNLNNWHLEYPRLTTKGLNQCYQVKENMPPVDVVLVSPLRRTLETANFIFDKTNKFIAIDSIREVISNPCDFKEPNHAVMKNFNHVDFSLSFDNNDYNKREAEDDVDERVDFFWNYLKNLDYEKIAVVTHGAFLKKFIELSNKLVPILFPLFL